MTRVGRLSEGLLAALTLFFGIVSGAAFFWLVLYARSIPAALTNGRLDWIDQQVIFLGLFLMGGIVWIAAWMRAFKRRTSTDPFRRFIAIGVPTTFVVIAVQSFEVASSGFDSF